MPFFLLSFTSSFQNVVVFILQIFSPVLLFISLILYFFCLLWRFSFLVFTFPFLVFHAPVSVTYILSSFALNVSCQFYRQHQLAFIFCTTISWLLLSKCWFYSACEIFSGFSDSPLLSLVCWRYFHQIFHRRSNSFLEL